MLRLLCMPSPSISCPSSSCITVLDHLLRGLLAMVVPCAAPPAARRDAAAAPPPGIPVVDMSRGPRGELSRRVVRACAGAGFFKVVNHGVPPRAPARLEAAAAAFFARPPPEKARAGPPTPLGYGCRDIGSNGDVGELEYLLLHASPAAVALRARTIDARDPAHFSDVVNEYVEAVRQLACEILELLAEGLGLKDTKAVSRLIRDTDSDSLLRINHYPPCCPAPPKLGHDDRCAARIAGGGRVGFGEHSDPQILSILRSNDVDGLQVLLPNGTAGETWVQVPADPSAFFVHVGDLLQAMTNGRLISIRHKAMASSGKPRLSTIYFAAPPLQAQISALPGTVTAGAPRRYRPFTWAEYKKTMYSLRLSHSRLDLFRADDGDDGGRQEE